MTGQPRTGTPGQRAVREAIARAALAEDGETVARAPDHGDLPEGCPIVPLGVSGKTYFFLKPNGVLTDLTPREFTENGIAALFGGELAWLWQHYVRLGKDGNPIGINHSKAAAALMRACERHPFWSADEGLRGAGSWLDGKDRIVVHCGDSVRDGLGRWHSVPVTIAGRIYAAARAQPRPAAAPASAAHCGRLLNFLERWAWRAPAAAPRLLLGWLCAALVCGVLTWRPHVWVTGDKAMGKSTLEKLLRGLFGAGALRSADASPTAIRQMLGGACMPVMMDEQEVADSRMAEACILLARLASTRDQAATHRGSPEGKVREEFVRAMFYFSAILHPPLKPQDRDRITIFELDRLVGGDEARDFHEEFATVAGLGPALRARVIERWPAIRAAQAHYSRAMFERKATNRQVDQYGTMLAFADAMLSDAPVDELGVREVLDVIDLRTVGGDDDDADHDECLAQLLSAHVDTWSGGVRRTLGMQIASAVRDGERSDAGKALWASGCRLERIGDGEGGALELAVAQKHAGLERIFEGTRWARGVWWQALRRLPNAYVTKGSLYFGGPKVRAVMLAIDLVTDPSAGHGARHGPSQDDGEPRG